MIDDRPDRQVLSPDQATAKLAEMSAEFRGKSKATKDPKTPAQAAARLDELRAIDGWAKLYLAGSGPHVAEFNRLHELASSKDADNIDAAIAGTPADGIFLDKGHRDNVQTAVLLRDAGVDDPAVLRQVLSNAPVSAAERDAAQSMKSRLMKDHNFQTRYLSGDGDAVRQMALLNVVLTREVKTEEA
jgi:hypothetical protein